MSDITINWEVSPRIITVLAPSANVSMQDLYDTLRSLEDDMVNMDNDYIVSGSGKEFLGGGVYVGLTVTLNNAQLAFEERLGPSFVQCTAGGGNLVSNDINGNNIFAIYPTAYTQVILSSSTTASIIGVDQTSIRTAVWDASLSQHQLLGSTGKTLGDTAKETLKKIVPFLFAK